MNTEIQLQDTYRTIVSKICAWLETDTDPITEGERQKCYEIIVDEMSRAQAALPTTSHENRRAGEGEGA